MIRNLKDCPRFKKSDNKVGDEFVVLCPICAYSSDRGETCQFLKMNGPATRNQKRNAR